MQACRSHGGLHRAALVAAVMVFGAGCTATSDPSTSGPAGSDDPTTVTVTATDDAAAPADEPDPTVTSESEATTVTTAATPATRAPDLPRVDLGEFNIGHGAMNETLVELMWTSVEGDDVTHRIYRVPTIGTDLQTVELSDDLLVYTGGELSFTDRSAPPGQFWTYVMEIDADGRTNERRAWTSVLTITDTTPPADVTGLTAEVTAEGVLLRWQPADDDVEFGAYAVLLVAEDGTASYLGGGADVGQTSFLDDRPPSGSITYRVQAVDYHDNRSTAEIMVDVP